MKITRNGVTITVIKRWAYACISINSDKHNPDNTETMFPSKNYATQFEQFLKGLPDE